MNPDNLMDLHVRLRGDETGEQRSDLLARLRRLSDECAAAKRQLLDRESYRRVQAAGTAVAAAIRIVEGQRTSRSGN